MRRRAKKGPGLPGGAAAVDGGVDVVVLAHLGQLERLRQHHTVGFVGEVLLDGAVVHRDLARSVTDTDTGDCTLASAGCLNEWMSHDVLLWRAQRARA